MVTGDQLEHGLLRTMITDEGIRAVAESGLGAEVIETPALRVAFETLLDYWQEHGSTPTLRVLEDTVPKREFPEPEEPAGWFIGELRTRHAWNAMCRICEDALTTGRPNPLGNLAKLIEDAGAVLEAVGSPPSGPRLWQATDLKPAAQPRWLARGRLPRGAVSLLVGDEGIGKSLLWVWIAAAVTTGGRGLLVPKFGIPRRDPEHVLIAAVTEDDWQTVVRPRLEVAGADLDMVRVICADDDGSGAPTFPGDIGLITGADPRPALVVVDAWLDTVPKDIVVKDPQGARLALHPWKEAATLTDAAIWLLCHTNRVSTANARDRYGITSELRKKARMTLFAQADDEGRLVVGPDKSNMSAPIAASVFAIEKVRHFEPTDDDDGTVPRLVYREESTRTAREHITDTYAAEHGNAGGGGDVVGWLAVFLARGPRWVRDVTADGDRAGYTKKRLDTAKRTLHVQSKHDGSTNSWFWVLPQHEGRVPAQPNDEQDPHQGPCVVDGDLGVLAGQRGDLGDLGQGTGDLAFSTQDNLSTSQDTIITSRGTRGSLGHLAPHHDDAPHLLGEGEESSPRDAHDEREMSPANPLAAAGLSFADLRDQLRERRRREEQDRRTPVVPPQ